MTHPKESGPLLLVEDVMAELVKGGLNARTAEVTCTGVAHVLTALGRLGLELREPNEHDIEDCGACADLDVECRFHRGVDAGYRFAADLVKDALTDPETVEAAFRKRDRRLAEQAAKREVSE